MKDDYAYCSWQCVLMLFCGVVGLTAVFIQPGLPLNISIPFAIVFVLCMMTAVFFLLWIKHKRKQEKEDGLIDSIGQPEYMD